MLSFDYFLDDYSRTKCKEYSLAFHIFSGEIIKDVLIFGGFHKISTAELANLGEI